MNNIIIKIDTKTAKAHCEYNKIGVQHANLQNKLIFEMSEKINGSAWLEYEINGTKNYAEMEDTENGYQIDIKSCLLVSNNVNVDLKITESEDAEGIPIFISTIVELDVYDSINATTEEPEYYPDWKTVADSKIAEMNQLKEDVNEAITKTNNLNIDVSKSGKTATITLTKKDNTTKTVTLSDGTSLMFNWNGTKLGIKTDDEQEYTYVDLIGPQGIQGETGATPNLTIGTVITGNTSSATITGTPENPVLNLVLEKGDTGETGATGNGIASIAKTGTSGNIDTYTITYTNGNTSTFTVTNGEVSQKQLDAVQEQLDKYKSIANVLPKVEGEGTNFTLEDTADGAPLELMLEGNTSQETTTGKNLSKISDGTLNYEGLSITIDKGVITLNGTTASSSYIKLSNNLIGGAISEWGSEEVVSSVLNKTFSINVISGTAPTTGFAVRTYINGAQDINANQLQNNRSFSKTYTSDGVMDYIYIYSQSNKTYDNFKFTIQLENGSEVTSFEPYTYGASPNPDYPQPIKVVTGNQNVEISNKNLYTNENATYSSTYITPIDKNGFQITCGGAWSRLITQAITIKKNTDYVFKLSYSTGKPYIRINDSNNTAIVEYYMSNYPNGITFNSGDNDVVSILIYPSGNSSSYDGQLIVLNNIQLEEGSTVTEFAPYYTPQTYPLSLGNIELAKIVNYKDYIFKNVVGSKYYNAELENDGWYKYKVIGKVILNGSESWSQRTNNVGTKQFFVLSAATDILPNSYIRQKCNYGVFSRNAYNSGTVGNFNIIYSNGAFYLCVPDDFDLDTFKTNISNNNIISYYVIATPTYVQITDPLLTGQLENINQAVSAGGSTIITCSSESEDNETIQVSASTYLDLNTVLNRVATLETEV